MSSIFPKVRDVWSRRTLPAKLFSFASIGVVNLGVDVTFFTLAFQFLHLPLVASNVICWMVAVTGSYAMNAKITFGQETGGVFSIERYLRFAASGILGLVNSTTVLVWLSRYTNVPVAKLASIIAGFGFNFSMSHFVVFRSYRMTSKRPAVHPKRSDEPLAIVRRIKTLKTIYRTKLQPQKLLHRIFVPADERREEYFGRKMASLREWAAKNPEKPRGEILEEASRINPYFLKLSRRWVWPKDLDASLREHAKQAPPEHGIDEQALRGALALLQDPRTQERFKGLVVEELERLPDFERDLGVLHAVKRAHQHYVELFGFDGHVDIGPPQPHNPDRRDWNFPEIKQRFNSGFEAWMTWGNKVKRSAPMSWAARGLKKELKGKRVTIIDFKENVRNGKLDVLRYRIIPDSE